MRRLLRGCVLLAAALVVGLGPVPALADGGDPLPGTPADRAAQWLLAEADGGTWAQSGGDLPDWGLTTDALLGLTAAGVPRADLAEPVAALEAAVADGTYAFLGDPEHTEGGAIAKAVLVVADLGLDPRAFGGTDLVARLQEQVEGTQVDPGSPTTNTFAQAYAVMALARVGEDVDAVTRGLLLQQCPAGDFRLGLGTQPCFSDAVSADRDATAIAVAALRAAGTAPAELARAVDFLAADQTEDGAWVASRYQAVPNSNSAGLAARALAGLRPWAVAQAAGFTASLQLTSGPDAGAVAYDEASVAGAEGQPASVSAEGEITAQRFQWHRATAQALLALTQLDVRTTPGEHDAHGTSWRTACTPPDTPGAAAATACALEVWGTTTVRRDGGWGVSTGWHEVVLTEVPRAARAS